MDKLGFDSDTFVRFKAAVDAPHGLLLVTGRLAPEKPQLILGVERAQQSGIQHHHRRRSVEFQIRVLIRFRPRRKLV